ncbi:MAG TPA: MoaD/ThiS family protein [Candidatus Limnocylindria bacterium]|nr:MoaD/ThiS family protein [Candidatus Limnocylindria bacterium]
MKIPVQLWSYFTELAGTSQVELELPPGAKIDDLLTLLYQRHPRLGAMRNSTLVAVGVDYQGSSYVLQEGDEVSLFPPVQGG